MSVKREQPAWTPPEGSFRTGLRVANSLALGRLVEFVPARGREVSFYVCGPTVYDSSHLGHARNYVSFDVIRRILSDHFGYNVTCVMNITDVDDKIIKRARVNRLLADYVTRRGEIWGRYGGDVGRCRGDIGRYPRRLRRQARG